MEVKTIQSIPSDVCTGCGACLNKCPLDAIKMQSDTEGFLQPFINKELCNNCGVCYDVCPAYKPKAIGSYSPSCYAAWSTDENIRFNSTSGGVFTHLALAVLEQGGAVIGARYRDDHLVEHAIIYNSTELASLRQSKYVQSEIGYIYREVEKNLNLGRLLLFVGTPCQCAGLKSFLNKEYSNLILCDFICRGVNSPMVYRSYLNELEYKYNSKIKRVWFKNKTFGWNKFATKVIFENGDEYVADRETDPFMLGYIKSHLSLYMRRSCYRCNYKGISRSVDITLGDFWGVERVLDGTDTSKGVSAVVTHTNAGEKLLHSCNALEIHEKHIDDLILNNNCILNNVRTNKSHQDLFYDLIKKNVDFSSALNILTNLSGGTYEE